MRALGLVLSTGRCGTSSLEAYLRSATEPTVRVYHERLKHHQTKPGRFFRTYSADAMREQAALPPVAALLEELDGLGPSTTYIETGWTAYPLYPLLLARYGSRARLLHVTRHPVVAAASTALHGLYDEATERDFGVPDEHFLRPWTAEAPAYFERQAWDTMTLFERNLFRVCAISEYLLELHERYPDVPYRRVKLEEFSETTGREVLEYFGLPAPSSDRPLPRSNELKRASRTARPIGPEWRRAFSHDWAVRVGERLGYDMSAAAADELAPRMRKYALHGAWERLAHLAYRVGPLRRTWRLHLGPWLRRQRARVG
jgi:hypothetical protein